jgi:alpha-mannosidase
MDPDGGSHPVEVLDGISKKARFWAADVPAFGYRVFHIVNGPPRVMLSPKIAPDFTLENDNLLVKFDHDFGNISEIVDKRTGRTISSSGLGRIEEQLEADHDMSSWDIGKITKITPLPRGEVSERWTSTYKEITFNYKMEALDASHPASTVRQTFRLEKGADMVTSRVECDWNEVGDGKGGGPNLRLAFDTGLASPKATYDVPFGALSRPMDNREYPGQKWADVGNGDYGVSVLNDSVYGMSATDSTLRLTLIRSSDNPDPEPNPGHHEWNYSIYPHAGTWQQAGTVRRSDEFNQPLVCATVPIDASGSNPLEWGLVDFSDPNVVATSLKGSEDGNGFVVRCYESAGSASSGSVRLGTAFDSANWVDLIEDPIGVAALNGQQLPLSLRPFEIRTVRLDRRNPASQ